MDGNISARGKKNQQVLRVLNPTVTLKFKPISHAKRLEDLKDKRIGLYWNSKAHGDIALNRVKELLSERFEGMSFEWFELGSIEEAKRGWFEKVVKSGVDGVVGATGD